MLKIGRHHLFCGIQSVTRRFQSSARYVGSESSRLDDILEKKDGFLCLGIETSCDDTAIAVVKSDGTILSHVKVNHWLKLREEFGGVYPPVACEYHREAIDAVGEEALRKASVTLDDIDVIGVTRGPGIGVCLNVGINYAVNLSKNTDKIVVGVNHLEAHFLTPRIVAPVPFPFLNLLVSGGNCQLVLAKDLGHYEILGVTVDDAPGEAYDKVGRAMGLLGGIEVAELAPLATEPIVLSGAMFKRRDCNFSFAGYKTQSFNILKRLEKEGLPLNDEIRANVSAGFQNAVVDHILHRLKRSLMFHPVKHMVASGGVASNLQLRKELKELCDALEIELQIPPVELCTDNGVMIAWAAIERIKRRKNHYVDGPLLRDLAFHTSWPLGNDVSAKVVAEAIKIRPKSKLQDFAYEYKKKDKTI